MYSFGRAGMVTKLGVIVLFTPLFLGVHVGVAVFGLYLENTYLKAQRFIKRETRYIHEVFHRPVIAYVASSNARSRMLAHFSAAIRGIGMYASKRWSLMF